jgi:hypothetical protein
MLDQDREWDDLTDQEKIATLRRAAKQLRAERPDLCDPQGDWGDLAACFEEKADQIRRGDPEEPEESAEELQEQAATAFAIAELLKQHGGLLNRFPAGS